MSKTRYIKTDFWSDSFIEGLTPEQKLLYIYLFSNDKVDLCGIYEISYRKISFETGISQDKVGTHIEYFTNKGKAIYTEGYIYIINFTKNLSINPSVKAGIERSFLSLPQNIIDAFGLDMESSGKVIKRVGINKYQRERILTRDGNKCTECGTDENLEIDHIIPVFKGGKNIDENIRVLCRECNTINKNEHALTGSDRLGQGGTLIPVPELIPGLIPKPSVVATQPNEYLLSIDYLKSYSLETQIPDYAEKYRDEWIKFCIYWGEKGKTGKIRAEGEKTFEIKKRFATWMSRKKEQYQQKNIPKESALDITL